MISPGNGRYRIQVAWYPLLTYDKWSKFMTAYNSLQLNLCTKAILGTEESGRCGDVTINRGSTLFHWVRIGKVYR